MESPTVYAPLQTRLKQRGAIGGGFTNHRVSGSRFQVIPGFLGAISSATAVKNPPLDIAAVRAKADALGADIPEETWQADTNPFFTWERPGTGLDVAGYSYAIDGEPDETIETTATSFDVMLSEIGSVADGKHTFTVRAIGTSGTSGTPISFEFWVDTTPPQVTAYSPSSGNLFNAAPSLSVAISDALSDVNASAITLLLNGTSVSGQFDQTTGQFTATSSAWREGTNSLSFSVEDLVGNKPAPLIWSVVMDTTPPTGAVVINGGAEMTTSVYVTLSVTASDATSGIARMLLSNDELTGYVEEPFATLRELWKLTAIRGQRSVYVKFVDKAGNVSAPVTDAIDLGLLAPDTVLLSGPAGFNPSRSVTFAFLCPEGGCVFSVAFDGEEWSPWDASATATRADLVFGNHYFRVKAAKEANGIEGIQPDEEDPSPAERTWIVGVEPSTFIVPKGPPIKLWRLE